MKKTDEIHYQNIANAIRLKNGEATLYKPSEMAEAISDIAIGNGDGILISKQVCFFSVTGQEG